MELPISVLIHNDQLGLKGAAGTLVQIQPEGYYLVMTRFGSKLHRVQLPIGQTILIHEDPEEPALPEETIEIER